MSPKHPNPALRPSRARGHSLSLTVTEEERDLARRLAHEGGYATIAEMLRALLIAAGKTRGGGSSGQKGTPPAGQGKEGDRSPRLDVTHAVLRENTTPLYDQSCTDGLPLMDVHCPCGKVARIIIGVRFP